METIIKITNLTYKYNNFLLDNINLDIKKGEYISIIGKNGSGKSTLSKLIDGLLKPYSGEIIVDNLIVNDKNIKSIHSKVGIIFQNPDNQFVGSTVEDDVAFGLENRQFPHKKMVRLVKESLNMVGMSKYAKYDPSKLSGGQKQRVAIAGIIAIHPKIIILDEATSMLDPEGKRNLLNLIQKLRNKYNLTIISITHDIDETILSDKIIVLNNGCVVMNDTPQVIFKKKDLLLKIGLDIPFTEKLKYMLKKRGVHHLNDNYLDEKEMAIQLCQLNLKM